MLYLCSIAQIMIKPVFLLLVLSLFLQVTNSYANTGEYVRVGVHYNPPLCSIDSTNEAKGIFIDVINEVAAINNWTIEYVPTTLTDGIEAIHYGKIDLLTTVARTREREKFIHFSEESIYTNWGIVYCNKSNDIESITDLENRKVALENGDVHAIALVKLLADFKIEAEIIWCNNLIEVFDKINSGVADAGAVNKLFGYQQNLSQKLKATPILFNPVNVHIAGGPLSKPTLNKVDEALQYLKNEEPEYYQGVINQWLIKGERRTPYWLRGLVLILFAVTFVLVLVLIILRSAVRKKAKSLDVANEIGQLRANAILQLEKEKTLILNSLDEQVVFMDNEYNLVWANDAFKNATSVPFEQLIGKKCYSVYFQKDKPCDFCQFETCLKTNRTEVREHVSEISGKVFTHKTHTVYDAEHRSIGFVEILSDVTDKKKYEDELIKAKEKAEQSDYLKSAFLANMSHEIRTPMNAIIGFSELLEDDTLSLNDKRSYLRIIQSNGNQLLKLISDILIFSQIESGHVQLQFSCINVLDFLQEIKKQFNSEVKKHSKNLDIVLEVNVGEQLEIETDVVRFKQVIFNLLTNAIKFTDEGQITIRVSEESDKLILVVKDTGIGIPHEQHDAIFERFSQVENKQTRKLPGSGLGLTIAKDLILQMGGTISLESEVGVGSEFCIKHPFQQQSAKKESGLMMPHLLNAQK
ncbi:ATP-binding protein [Carboxylicivirga sp. M1479]|uniref:hybrid sensor histidine kinase/response regulator n=1 Tax=Carboxylicivirga sp. M1479 TaxID=2594476 RepID=UPI001178CCC5|nr:ATP-binding protein [Carboxylicivirga sp. M1479]TRX71824.1 transporter substrate-binding domain-containing protein [Carboxylicivirga sp. M1479]